MVLSHTVLGTEHIGAFASYFNEAHLFVARPALVCVSLQNGRLSPEFEFQRLPNRQKSANKPIDLFFMFDTYLNFG